MQNLNFRDAISLKNCMAHILVSIFKKNIQNKESLPSSLSENRLVYIYYPGEI